MRLRYLFLLFAIALPAAAGRVGELGMTVTLPKGWRVVPATEAPTAPPFERVVTIGDPDGSIQIVRGQVPVQMTDTSPAALLRLTATMFPIAGGPQDLTIAGAPAVMGKAAGLPVYLATVRRGEMFYLFIFAAGDEDPAALRTFREVLDSAQFNKTPARLEAHGVSLVLPDGWRQMRTDVAANAKEALLVVKHDVAGQVHAAAVQVRREAVPQKLHGASSIEIASTLAFVTARQFHSTFDGAHEVRVADRKAAEWKARYQLTESDGAKSDMASHMIVIAGRNDHYYLIGYVAPASDTADAAKFTEMLKTLMIAEE